MSRDIQEALWAKQRQAERLTEEAITTPEKLIREIEEFHLLSGALGQPLAAEPTALRANNDSTSGEKPRERGKSE